MVPAAHLVPTLVNNLIPIFLFISIIIRAGIFLISAFTVSFPALIHIALSHFFTFPQIRHKNISVRTSLASGSYHPIIATAAIIRISMKRADVRSAGRVTGRAGIPQRE